jgi:hypothetical protein
MNPEAEQMRRELVIAHPGLMDPSLTRVYTEMGRALKLIPTGSTWMVAEAEIAVCAHRDGLLFVASVAPGEARVTISSRRLEPPRMGAALEWGQAHPNEDVTRVVRATRWSFRHPGIEHETWQRVNGSIALDHEGNETLDRRELFARELAALAGWEGFA